MSDRVEIYRNLHRDCFSVRDMKTRLVIDHRDVFMLTDASFHVSEAGRQRVLKEKRKNVHATVRGILSPKPDVIVQREFIRELLVGNYEEVKYNPYLYGFFWREGYGAPLYGRVYDAHCVVGFENKIYLIDVNGVPLDGDFLL